VRRSVARAQARADCVGRRGLGPSQRDVAVAVTPFRAVPKPVPRHAGNRLHRPAEDGRELLVTASLDLCPGPFGVGDQALSTRNLASDWFSILALPLPCRDDRNPIQVGPRQSSQNRDSIASGYAPLPRGIEIQSRQDHRSPKPIGFQSARDPSSTHWIGFQSAQYPRSPPRIDFQSSADCPRPSLIDQQSVIDLRGPWPNFIQFPLPRRCSRKERRRRELGLQARG
jgi:hypothetical protein